VAAAEQKTSNIYAFISHNRRGSFCICSFFHFTIATMASPAGNAKKRKGKNTDFYESHFFDTGKCYEVNGKVYDAVPLLQCRYCKSNFEKLESEVKLQRAAPKELRKELTLCENHLKGCRHYKDAASVAVGAESSAGTPASAARVSNTNFQERHILEFGLTIQHRNTERKVDSVRCEFCQHFGREAKPDAVRATRKSVSFFTPPFRRESYISHVESQHPAKWEEYQQLSPQQQLAFFGQTANLTFFGEQAAIANSTTQNPEHTLVQQYEESANEAKKELERLKLANAELRKKLRKCEEKLHVNEMFSIHDKTKIENLEKEKAQLEEINRILKGSSDDESTNDLEIEEL
jgi:hypothetical protein